MTQLQYTPKELSAQSLHPPPDSAAQLAHAQAGCPDCLNALMSRHDGLVHWLVRQLSQSPLDYDEAVQAGRIGLWQALLHFDPTRGVAFSTYAVVAMRRHIDREGHRYRRFWRPLPFLPSVPLSDPVAEALWRLTCQAVPRWVAQLPPHLRFVVRAYYGLEGYRPQVLLALGLVLGRSKQRAHQLLHEALHWLALPQLSWEIRLLLERTSAPELRAALRAWPISRRYRWTRWRPYP